MATTVVSARVDEELKSAANAYISEAGTTMGEIMKTVLSEIVRTKEIPIGDDERIRRKSQHQKYLDFMEWRSAVAAESDGTAMNDAQAHDAIVSQYE